jgi:hypothetical protein
MDRDGRDLIAEVTIDKSEKGLQEPPSSCELAERIFALTNSAGCRERLTDPLKRLWLHVAAPAAALREKVRALSCGSQPLV